MVYTKLGTDKLSKLIAHQDLPRTVKSWINEGVKIPGLEKYKNKRHIPSRDYRGVDILEQTIQKYVEEGILQEREETLDVYLPLDFVP